MNLARADQIAKTVLYEGYMLYPYRPSSVKNRQRWNFGVVYPRAYSEAQGGEEACSMRTECLVSGSAETSIEVKLRFLHLQTRSAQTCSVQPAADVRSDVRTGSLPDGWQEAVEREVSVPELAIAALLRGMTSAFAFPSQLRVESEHDGMIEHRQEAVEGRIDVSAESVGEDLFRLSVHVQNLTPMEFPAANRDAALMQSLVSTHTILGVTGGAFVSLLEPPAEVQELVADCKNVGAWPVLVGEPGQRDTLLASPIILYDYPQIAPESVGDLFDGTEIDEILSLRIMTLTDEEKREIRESDDRARQILERTDAMPVEQFMKLHGAVRGLRPLKENVS
jgi:hydrogenase maturation protease